MKKRNKKYIFIYLAPKTEAIKVAPVIITTFYATFLNCR